MSYTVAEERMQNYIEELEQENRLLRARNDRLEAEAKAVSVQEPLTPEGWSLVAVTGFDQLIYWLDRCERKGHLENCPDLIEPYEAFDYRIVTTTLPAAKQWVDMPELELLGAYEEEQQGRFGDHIRGLINVQNKLKEKNS